MAYNKRTWLGRQGTGLNKFSIGGATPVTIVNQPDSVTQVGDALSAGNLNDLEDRIEDAFDETASQTEVSNLNNAITALDHRVENLEQAKGDYIVSAYKDGSITPSGKGKWCVVEGVEGVSRVANNLLHDVNSWYAVSASMSVADGVVTFTRTGDNYLGYQVVPVVNGHKYILAIEVMASEACNVTFSNIIEFGSASVLANTWTKLYFIQDASFTSSAALRANAGVSNGETLKIKDKAVITDLSVYFNGTIPSDADTIAEIQTNYPHLLTPSDYGVRIVDSSYSGVRAYSANMANSDLLVDPSASVTKSGDVYSCSSAYNLYAYSSDNKVLKGNFKENTQYNISWKATCGSATNIGWHFHYTDGTSSSRLAVVNSTSETYATGYSAANKTIDYIYFNYGGGTTFSFSELMVNEGTSAMPYSPYGAIDTLSLTFQGKSAGSVSEMYYPETGEQTHPLKRITLDGTESWSGNFSSGIWVELDDLVHESDYIGKILASGGFITVNNYNTVKNTDYTISGYYDNTGTYPTRNFLYIRITSTENSPALVKTWLQNHPITVTYELVTPNPSTFVTPIIDNTLLTEAYGRMSTVQTGTVVDGSFDMGFITL